MSGSVIFRRFAPLIVGVLAALLLGGWLLAGQEAFAQGGYAAVGTVASSDSGSEALREPQSPYAEVAKVRLNLKKATIHNDGKLALAATLVPDVAGKTIRDKTVKWRISDKKVASITQKGVVQGKRAGTATVTATAKNGKAATAKVKVVIDPGQMAETIPVLTYHRIASDTAVQACYQGQTLVVSASMFSRQMRWLKRNGYRTISTAEFRDWRVNGTFLPKKSVLVTIDDGFYETYHVAYPILKRYKLKATSFVIGTHVKKKTRKYNPYSNRDHYLGWDVIERVREDYPNLEFQSHTYNMHHRGADGNGVARSWSREMIDADFDANDQFGFSAIAYPFGHTSANMTAAARASQSIKMGFGYMMSWPATRTSPLYNIPRFKVMGTGSLGEFAAIASTAR